MAVSVSSSSSCVVHEHENVTLLFSLVINLVLKCWIIDAHEADTKAKREISNIRDLKVDECHLTYVMLK